MNKTTAQASFSTLWVKENRAEALQLATIRWVRGKRRIFTGFARIRLPLEDFSRTCFEELDHTMEFLPTSLGNSRLIGTWLSELL